MQLVVQRKNKKIEIHDIITLHKYRVSKESFGNNGLFVTHTYMFPWIQDVQKDFTTQGLLEHLPAYRVSEEDLTTLGLFFRTNYNINMAYMNHFRLQFFPVSYLYTLYISDILHTCIRTLHIHTLPLITPTDTAHPDTSFSTHFDTSLSLSLHTCAQLCFLWAHTHL